MQPGRASSIPPRVRVAARFVLAAAVLLAPAAVRADGLAWTPYESETGRFRVLLPAAPVPTSGAFETRAGSVPEVGVETETADLVVKVEHHDLPRLACLLLPDERILEFAASGLLRDRHGRLESEEPTLFQGHPGRMLRYLRSDLGDREEEARLVLVGHRLYIALARAQGSDAREPIGRFFDSLEIWED
ncbi:MAG TPA: hypothetical protein DEP35_18455 [Deltaproteobacteria bacterium]|nr:hypothetical protein [Deltaproteobacteria bacterium]